MVMTPEDWKKLLTNLPIPKCRRCEGSGIITVEGIEWTPVVCTCGACGGSGYRNPKHFSLSPFDQHKLEWRYG